MNENTKLYQGKYIFQIIYLTKDLYSECIKYSQNATIRKQTNQLKNE